MKNNKHHFRHNFAKCFYFNRKIKVGILGGSFNPAHHGHIHISSIALKKLKLDEIWWLVSPQNRLKKTDIRSTFETRINFSKQITCKNKKIKVLDLEKKNKLFSTYKSLKLFKKKSRSTKFVWLMGSDNLLNFHNWLKAKEIAKIFPVAVIERPSYSYKVINSLGANTLGRRLDSFNKNFFTPKNKSWIFIRDKLNNISSTKIRNLDASLLNEKDN